MRALKLIFLFISIPSLYADSIISCLGLSIPLVLKRDKNDILSVMACEKLSESYANFRSFKSTLTFPITDPSISRVYFEKENALNELTIECQDKRFKFCFSTLKPSISKKDLDLYYNDWIKDPRFRYPTGGGSCQVRANHLAYELAQLGYSAKALRIGSSPTLIAMERNTHGDLNGNYYDYQGYHSVVEIIVKENGKSIPYILDPQFMNSPLPRDLYFIQTMGQVCLQESHSNKKKVRSKLNCYYSIHEQNFSLDPITAHQAIHDDTVACGWYFDIKDIESFVTKANSHQQTKNDLTLKSLSHVSVPEALRGTSVHEDSGRLIILASYQKLKEAIQDDIQEAQKQIRRMLKLDPSVWSEDIKFKRRVVKQLKTDLDRLQEKLEEVKKSLNLLKRKKSDTSLSQY